LPALVRWQKVERDKSDLSPNTGVRWGLEPSTDYLFGQTAEGLAELNPRGRAKLSMQNAPVRDGPDLRVLATWQDGQPLVLQRRIGRGVVFGITLPFTTELSDFALRPAFLVLLKHVVDTARSRGGVARSPVGSTWTFDGFRSVSVSRLLPDGGHEVVAVQGEVERTRVVVDRLGLYELTLDGEKTHRVAAMAEREVDLRPREVHSDPEQASLGGTGMTVDLSPYVALCLLMLMFAELVLRTYFQRRPGPSSEQAQT
jgi:hypothetical protein